MHFLVHFHPLLIVYLEFRQSITQLASQYLSPEMRLIHHFGLKPLMEVLDFSEEDNCMMFQIFLIALSTQVTFNVNT